MSWHIKNRKISKFFKVHWRNIMQMPKIIVMDPCKFVTQIANDMLNGNNRIWSWVTSSLQLYKIWVYKTEKGAQTSFSSLTPPQFNFFGSQDAPHSSWEVHDGRDQPVSQIHQTRWRDWQARPAEDAEREFLQLPQGLWQKGQGILVPFFLRKRTKMRIRFSFMSFSPGWET